ncbi:MAG: hypothetical protein SRB2_00406 [Desulfobacteraceae bacterium Eth-SRB2]|nr:MAG: hypothetical protein SRB2_00406 [Desulfobacteraceae bacterium Eth-SRB2]
MLLVDAGDFFWRRKLGELRSETTARALRMMDYDALNVADGELSFGIDYLSAIYPGFKHEFLSSNLIKDGNTIYQPFIIKTYNRLKIAVLGVVSPSLVDEVQLKKDAISVESPLDALKRLLPDIKKDVDLVLLLSHSGWENTADLAQKISGIDIAIVGHAYYNTLEPNRINDTMVFKNSVGGKHLGVVKIWVDESKKIKNIKSSLEELSDKIYIYPEFTLPETEFEKKKQELSKRNGAEKKHARMMEKFKEYTKLSPEEFTKKMKETGGTFETKP